MSERISGQSIGDSERWISVLAGMMLILSSLPRRVLTGLVLALGGAALVFRGVTGHDNLGAAVRGVMSSARGGRD